MKPLWSVSLGWKRGLLALGLSSALGLASWSPDVSLNAQDAQEKTAETPAGLRGILPSGVPFGLLEDDFLTLGASWSDWSKGAAAEVARFYEAEDLDVAGQRAALGSLKKKLGTIEKALADARYRSIFDQLAALHGRLSRRIAVSEAILDTFEVDPATAHAERVKTAQEAAAKAADSLNAYLSTIGNTGPWREYVRVDDLRKLANSEVPANVVQTVQSRLANADQLENEQQRKFLKREAFVELQEKLDAYVRIANAPVTQPDTAALRETLTSLVSALEQYEENRSIEAASAARDAFSQLRSQAPDGGDRLGAALSTSYFNYNLRVVASERFLSKLVQESRNESGYVDDFILGAKVDGSQTTATTVGLDLQPSSNTARFAITLSGVSQTSTQGVTDQAVVFTSGYHQFWASKPIAFDGDRFMTFPATINVSANNTTTGAQTNYSNVPLLGGIADSYAVGEARKRRAESESIAAGRLRDRVLPRFNGEVDAEFGKRTQEMQEQVIPRLRETGLYPSARSFKSTDSEMFISTRLMANGELGGDSTPLTASSPNGVSIHLHESLLNNSFDRLGINGRSLTEQELKNEIANWLSAALGRDIKFEENKDEKPDLTKFIFPDHDPIRVRSENGQFVLVLRAGLKPEDEEEIPTQEITVPIGITIEGTNLKLEAGQVIVSPVERVANPVLQRARAGVVTTKIQKALPTRLVDRMIDLKRDDGAPIKLAVTQVKANGGWLSLVLE